VSPTSPVATGRPRRSGWYLLAVVILKPLLMLFTKRDWRGAQHLPATGGFVAVVNHVSYLDPFAYAHFLHAHRRWPRFLGKEAVFRVPIGGRIIRGAGQIPVYRGKPDAVDALRAAIAAVRAGECVVVYPEGTLTRDPGLWPMRGKSGAARIALETGCPIIPCAQWGPNHVMPPYERKPRVFPRSVMHIWAGPPVDLGDLRGQPITKELLDRATERVMADITGLLESIRGEQAPPERFDPVAAGLPEYGVPPAVSGGRHPAEAGERADLPRDTTDQHREPA
jgi:1-acyl-sn-glycerol-3-phosphate acyltransferase